jgi:tripartite-type tricarboxylate transporter receptor subunit TctC
MLSGVGIFAQIRAGKLRPLTAGLQRNTAMPGVPSLAEAGVDFSVDGWFGVVGPANMPRDIVGRLNREIRKILFEPAFRTKFVDSQGFRPIDASPEEFAAFLKKDRELLGRVVRQGKISLD